ncbi:amino acid adenylation domain-containing protein, partial [Paenibacillus sp. KR2-11]
MAFEKETLYWNEVFEGDEDTLTMIPYTEAPAQTQNNLRSLRGVLPGEQSQRIIQMSRGSHLAAYMILLSGVHCLLYRYTGSPSIVTGMPIVKRADDARRYLNHTIPVSSAVSADTTFRELLNAVKTSVTEGVKHQNIPFRLLTERLQMLHTDSGVPIVHTLVSLEGLHGDDSRQNVTADVEFGFEIADEQIRYGIAYNESLYSEAFMKAAAGHLETLFASVLADLDLPVGRAELLAPEEKTSILETFNDTAADFPRGQTIHGLFEEQASRRPEAVAVVCEGRQLTYAELNGRANRLARTLRDLGVQPDSIVGLMTERSVDMVVGLLAVLKAGGAYVPIDPGYPEDRIRYMLEDSGAKVLLTQRHLEDRATFGGVLAALDEERIYSADDSNLEPAAGQDNLAYVIYTSGTTGQPKGVMVEHRGLVSLKIMFRDTLGITEQDRIVQFASFSFDASCWEIYKALFFGAALYIPSSETILDYRKFENFMAENGITAAILPPTYAAYLHPDSMPGFRTLVTGGSAASPEFVQQWKERVSYFNAYGPTEASIVTSVWAAPSVGAVPKTVPIGRPIANHRLYVLDGSLNVLPVGVPGELCIGGVGVGRGYLNRPELTSEKFVEDPYLAGGRMYRTGDLVRWLPDGTIEYMGRIDHQVKIRGYRIELGEVEAQLAKADGVLEAAVTAIDDEAGQKQLCAYFTAERELSAAELRSAMSAELPGYMIPSHFVQLERMPLTPNGKINLKALPAPTAGTSSGTPYVEPRTPLEAQLAAIWQEVLGVPKVGVHDNFFELGGHSLRAASLIGKLYEEMNVELPFRDVFSAPTVEGMAEAVSRLEAQAYRAIPAAPLLEAYPLSSAQKRLFILQQLEGAEQTYNMPEALLLEGPLDRDRLEAAFRTLIARHESLRTGFGMKDGEPVQRIHAEVNFELEYNEADEAGAEELVRSFVRTFDLAKPPLLRVGLVRLGAERHILLIDLHHIVSDGVSADVLVDELGRLYAGEELAPLRIQYKDYAVWQGTDAVQEQLRLEEAYWLERFGGELPVLELPADYARPAVQSYEGSVFEGMLDPATGASLRRLAAESGTTLYMVLLAAYKVLLHKYTGQEDIVVGTPVAGRTHGDLQGLIGMFVGTLAVRSYPAAEKTFLSYLAEIKEASLGAYEHQNYPFEDLVDRLNLPRDLSRNPLFDTMFSLHTPENKELRLGSLTLSPYPSGQNIAKFDLSLDIVEEGEGFAYTLEYATALFKPETMQRFAGHFAELLRSIGEAPESKIALLPIVSSSELEEILHGFNPPAANSLTAPLHRPFHELFEEQAARTPEAAAVAYPGSELSYRELNERANVL